MPVSGIFELTVRRTSGCGATRETRAGKESCGREEELSGLATAATGVVDEVVEEVGAGRTERGGYLSTNSFTSCTARSVPSALTR